MKNEEFENSYCRDAATIKNRIIDCSVKETCEALDSIDFGDVQKAGERYAEAFVARQLSSPRDAWERELFAAIESGHKEFRLNPKFTEANVLDIPSKMADLPQVDIPSMDFFV